MWCFVQVRKMHPAALREHSRRHAGSSVCSISRASVYTMFDTVCMFMTQSTNVLCSSGKVQWAVCVQMKCEPPQWEAQGESRQKESSHRLTSRLWVISSAPHQRRKPSALGQHDVASWSLVLITSHMLKAIILHTGPYYSGASCCVCARALMPAYFFWALLVKWW